MTDASRQKEINIRILEALKQYKASAVGFVNESLINEGNREVLDLWLNDGQELGNHTYSHQALSRCTPEEFQQEITKGAAITKPLSQKFKTLYRYFRHPFIFAMKPFKL